MSDKKPNYDPEIMAELLKKPAIKKEIKGWDAAMLDWYKDLLIQEGIYAAYVKEREAK